ncbi:GNAT family N-acetyltransferase [Thalassobaculum sp. OXR-137]|uniref:GNAT family N-acetyltransferase n=1 Tax=Thalassobaculum sp. OXR-137 TaxID=3100173 RepID=UPI002AC8CC0A|nr:GNAT family N-acetyltransferase [Thalassobaculum sp. OXR-137]WPZ34933.1 GNAT family N-acetyltransferase [Thalassobaculum sp. OXR-137]
MSDRPAITLRPATADDSEDLLAWRNDPLTRANSRSGEPVTHEAHAAWMSRVAADANRHVWIALEGEAKVGSTSALLHEDGSVEISLTVAPEERGRRLASVLVTGAVAEVKALWPDARIRSEIKEGNTASRKAFEACGFEQVEERDGLLHYDLKS